MSAPERTGLWLPTAVTGDEYVGPYRLIRKAGSGGMGVVHLAVDDHEHPVAVKVLRDHIAHDTQARARLRRELMTMRRVRDRHIADVVDADLDADRPYIVSEFVNGPQLDAYIDRSGPLTREALANLGSGLRSALDAIHAVGVVHRDLKPGNVLLDGDRPVVIDFGIAQLADETRLTMTGLFVGTPGYVSPETIHGDPATPATDWWSWAAVMAYAATGASPAGTGPVEVVLDRIRRGDLRLDTVDADLRPLLQDCLAVRPADRPQSDQIRSRFDRYAAGGSTGPARAAAPVPPGSAAPIPQGAAAPATPSVAAQAPSAATAVLPRVDEPSDAAHRTGEPSAEQRPAPAVRRADGPHTAPGPARGTPARTTAPPTRRASGLPIFAFLALLTAAAMSMPVATGLLVVLLLTAARTIDGFLTGVQRRAHAGTSHRRAVLLQGLGSPWTILAMGVLSLATLALPAGLATGVAFGANQVLPAYLGPSGYTGNLAVGLGSVVALIALWYGPGGRGTRISVRRALRVLAPTAQSALALTAVLILAAAAIALVVYRFPVLDWWPLPGPPTRGL